MFNLMLEEHALYSRRAEEGYDLPDERYRLWLEHYYPKDSEICKWTWYTVHASTFTNLCFSTVDDCDVALSELFISSEDDQALPLHSMKGKQAEV